MLKPDWQIVAAVQNVADALNAIESQAPDLLVLDIHLPGTAGPEWIRDLDAGLPIVFVTGDPDFAVHAFEAAAVDYVLKPVTMRRLKTALDRAAADPRVGGRRGGIAGAGGDDGSLTWMTMSRGNDVLVVPTTQIVYLRADQKYTRVVTERGEGLVRAGISELASRLNPQVFVKVHRSVVVNLSYIASVKKNMLGYLEVHLTGRSEVLKVSKSFQQVFRSL